jgi:predicted nucleic acid-binding protein
MHEGSFERASEVQQRQTEAGQHRSAGAVDMVIAATAEHERLVILCDDPDYRAVAKVTGQAVRFVTD